MMRKMEDFHISIGKRTKKLLTVKIWGFWVEIIMHGANYRDGRGQVFTRKEYIKGKPQIKIAKFQGGKRGTYEYCVQLLMPLPTSFITATKRAVLQVVDTDDADRPVDYGETGRVMLTTLTKEFFVPRFLERDEGEREPPCELYPWDGVSGVRPFSALASSTTVGVY